MPSTDAAPFGGCSLKGCPLHPAAEYNEHHDKPPSTPSASTTAPTPSAPCRRRRQRRGDRHRRLQLPDGEAGIILDPKDPNLARQHPADSSARRRDDGAPRPWPRPRSKIKASTPAGVIGIGVDTTGCTPIPVDARGTPLAFDKRVREEPERAWPGSGRTTRASPRPPRSPRWPPQSTAAVPGQVRRHLLLRMVLEQDPALPADAPEGLRRRLHLGRVRRLDPRLLTGNTRPGQMHARRLRRRPQGHVQRRLGRLSGRTSSSPSSTRAWRAPRPALRPRPITADGRRAA